MDTVARRKGRTPLLRRGSGGREVLPPRFARPDRADGILIAMSIARSELPDDGPSWRQRLLEVPEDVPRPVWYGRIAAFLLMAVWGTGVGVT